MLVGWVVALFFFFNDTATTEIYTLSLHDALPISSARTGRSALRSFAGGSSSAGGSVGLQNRRSQVRVLRSEEHTSELQSRQYLVCRLLLEKKTTQTYIPSFT